MKTERKRYPVIHLSLSGAKGKSSTEDLCSMLMWLMSPLVEQYGTSADEFMPDKLLIGLTGRAFEKTGAQVAVIIDKYDALLLEVLYAGLQLE